MSKTTYEPRLKTLYNSEIRKALLTELKLENVNQVPEISKT